MFKGKTVTQLVVDEFGLHKKTIHRQIYGKKYPGGGQTLEKLRKEDKKVEASGSGTTTKIAVILKKAKATTDTEPPSKKGKGPGKKSGIERSAKDIRGAATAEAEKQKREVRKRKALEEEEEEEDPDKPTKAEIAASKPARKTLFIH